MVPQSRRGNGKGSAWEFAQPVMQQWCLHCYYFTHTYNHCCCCLSRHGRTVMFLVCDGIFECLAESWNGAGRKFELSDPDTIVMILQVAWHIYHFSFYFTFSFIPSKLWWLACCRRTTAGGRCDGACRPWSRVYWRVWQNVGHWPNCNPWGDGAGSCDDRKGWNPCQTERTMQRLGCC